MPKKQHNIWYIDTNINIYIYNIYIYMCGPLSCADRLTPKKKEATLTCDQQNHTLMYMHVWKAAGYSLMENLLSVGSGYEVTVGC